MKIYDIYMGGLYMGEFAADDCEDAILQYARSQGYGAICEAADAAEMSDDEYRDWFVVREVV